MSTNVKATNPAAQKEKKEPLVRIVKRDAIPLWRNILYRLIVIFVGLVVIAGVIYAIKQVNPIDVYSAIIKGAFGTTKRLWDTARDLSFLLLIAIGLAPAFKMKFWNIGAEGQILVGGIATAACMIYFKNLPTWLLFLTMVVASAVAGALWGLLPALFKSKFNTNETLFTLMMNYIALQLTIFFVGMWENPKGSAHVGIINSRGHQGWLPSVFGQEYFLNVAIVLAFAIGMFIYLKSTKQGYEIAVVGDSENTAKYAGISAGKVFIRTMLISGAICGLAGFLQVSGSGHTISESTAGGNGFTAIIVCWLAKFNTFTMILIAGLITVLDKGAIQIASQFHMDQFVADIITGIILFFILASEFFINYQLVFRHSGKEAE